MHSPKKFLRPAAVALFSAALLLTGCGADEPSAGHVALTLEAAFAPSQPVEVDEAEPQWVKTGEARLEGKTAFTLRLKENTYQPAELGDELAVLDLDSAETALLRQALEQAGMQAEPLRASLLEKAPPSIERQRFIKLSDEAGDEFPAEAVIKAQKGVEGWDLEIVNISQSRAPAGRPRSALPTEALVVGSPEAKKLVTESVEAVREYAALVEQSAADAARALSEAKAQKRAALLEVVKPGAVFLGTVANADKSVAESGLVIEEVEPQTGVVKGFAFESDPRRKSPFLGALREGETPLLFNISTDQPGVLAVAELDLQDGRLVGSLAAAELAPGRSDGSEYRLASQSAWGAVSWALSDQKALEAKIAAAAAREQEQRKRLDDYQAALSAALAPGQAFQGVWAYRDQRGEIGLFIETVAANGLSCAGYLFDPADRAKRKPFTGVVNREFGAESPLAVTTARGEGLSGSSSQLTATQESWLRADNRDTIQLTLADGGWTGRNRNNVTLELLPMPDFTALLAQDRAAEQRRQAAEQAAVRPGTAYAGTWRSGRFNGEIGLKMLTLGDSGQIFTAELFDPADPAVTWPYNGSVLQKDGRAAFSLVPLGNRRTTASSGQQGTTHFMLNDRRSSYHTLSLTLTAEGLSGALDTLPVVLKKVEAAPAPVPPTAAPAAPAPDAAAPAAAGAAAYPPLVLGSNGKPKIAAHRVSREGAAVKLALQVLAPGKKLAAVRIDNLGGIQAHWRSDNQEGAAPLAVSLAGQSPIPGTPSLELAAGEAEILLSLSLQDNGAFAGGATEFRITVFFADGERAMCFLKK